jgi:hypothetical protein
MGVATGDFDNDGSSILPDELRHNQIFHNNGNQDVHRRHESSGTGCRLGVAATFFDYDRDGWLDLTSAATCDTAPRRARSASVVGAIDYCTPNT